MTEAIAMTLAQLNPGQALEGLGNLEELRQKRQSEGGK